MTAPGTRSGAVSGNPASPAHVNRDTARRVVPLFLPYRAQVAAVVGLIVVTSTIGIINPLLIQCVLNKAVFVPGCPNLHLLVILVAIMAVVPIVNGAIGIVQTYETTRVGQLVMRDLRDRLYSHLQTLPLAFFTGTKTGEIQSRLANDVGGVQSVVTTTASTILANVVIFASTIVAMIILSWQLTIVAVITVPVFFWLTKMVGERRREVARSTQESLAAMSALSEETLSVSGVLLAKVFGNQARDATRYHEENQRLADLEVRQQMIGQGFYAIVQAFLSITPAAVYLIAGLLMAHGTVISAGTVVAFTTLQTRLYFPIGQLLQVSVELRSSLALFDRIFEYLDVVPDIVDAPDAVDLPAISSGGRVALREIYFRYPGAPADALAGVNLKAGPGQLVALVGPSGAGKTTISHLIPRLYDVRAGAIRINGVDVRDATLASIRAADQPQPRSARTQAGGGRSGLRSQHRLRRECAIRDPVGRVGAPSAEPARVSVVRRGRAFAGRSRAGRHPVARERPGPRIFGRAPGGHRAPAGPVESPHHAGCAALRFGGRQRRSVPFGLHHARHGGARRGVLQRMPRACRGGAAQRGH